MHDERRPWRMGFWLGTVDPRPLALFRIGLGLVLLQDLYRWASVLETFLTDSGAMPRGWQLEPWAWSLFDLVGSKLAVTTLFTCGVLVTIAFTVGLFTRVSTVLTWLFMLSLQNRVLVIGDGGDDLARVLLLWSIFTDLGATWSVDAQRGRGKPTAPALGARLVQWQLAFLYAATFYFKARRGLWFHEPVLFHTLQLTGFVRPGGAWLIAHPALCQFATLSTLYVEGLIPVLIVSPWFVSPSRALAILLNLGLQLGILLTMRVGIFTGVALVASLALVDPAWLAPRPAPAGKPGSPRWLALVVLAQFALSTFGQVIPRVPRIVEAELNWAGLNQGLDMFSTHFDVARWRAPGTLSDGRTVDVLETALPELQPKVELYFSRWTKFTFKAHDRFDALGAYLCRTWARKNPGKTLVRFTLVRELHAPADPGRDNAPGRTEVLHEQTCP